MKHTFIVIVVLFLVSIFVFTYLLDKFEYDPIEMERLYLLIPFTISISIVIYFATIDLFIGLLILLIYFIICFIFLCIISFENFVDIISLIFSAMLTFLLISIITDIDIEKTEFEKVSEKIIKLEKNTGTSENVIVIELIKDKKKLYSIMKYEGNNNLPFILYNDDITNYEISSKKEEKLVINKFESTSIDILSYFGFTKPTVDSYSEYNLYINEDSIKYK